jgi:anti-anti-sigma factor
MTLAYNTCAPAPRSSPADPVVDCLGARLTARANPLAMVLTISGEVDAANALHVRRQICRYVTAGQRLVIDMSGVEFLAVQGLQDLFELAEEFGSADVRWMLVASGAVRKPMQICGLDNSLPAVDSLSEALQSFATRPSGPRWLKAL